MPAPRKAKGMPDEPSLPGRCRHRAGLDPKWACRRPLFPLPTHREGSLPHPSAALISRVQNFRRKMCRTAWAPPRRRTLCETDRGFESRSLQRGVMCEPDFRGEQPQAIRFRAASPPRAVSSQNYRFESDRPRKESLRLICRGQSGIALRLPQHRSCARAAIRITAAERLNSTLLGHSASH
jgi:hypothetical protein